VNGVSGKFGAVSKDVPYPAAVVRATALSVAVDRG